MLCSELAMPKNIHHLKRVDNLPSSYLPLPWAGFSDGLSPQSGSASHGVACDTDRSEALCGFLSHLCRTRYIIFTP